jgi:hypothetical protein
MKTKVIFFLIIFLVVSLSILEAQEETVMIVSGTIKDAQSNQFLSGVTISVPQSEFSPVTSDSKGNYKFILMVKTPIEVNFSKEGYTIFKKLLTPQKRVELEVKLVPRTDQLRIVMSEFSSNSRIKGRVEGLDPTKYGDYKILVYVLTDKWYIHPYAENKAGSGFAAITSDGTWSIRTTFRGYQSTRIAFLLTKMKVFARPSVEVVSSNPEQELLSEIESEAKLIQDAPPGI